MIPQHTVELIKDIATTSILDVVGDFVKLKKNGSQYVGLSPFANERTPSFYVKPSKGMYKCFSTGKGGDIINFLQECQGWEFNDAVRYLAKKFSVSLEDNDFVFVPRVKEPEQVIEISFIHPEELLKSKYNFRVTNLYTYLSTKIESKELDKAFKLYHVGENSGWNIFWQVDVNTFVRSGKYIKYKEDGHRDKDQRTTWHHSATKEYKPVYPDFNLVQCFFGEHLISNDIRKPIAIVESEKTAIVCSVLMPAYIWLACGSKNGLNDTKCAVLVNRSVTLFPDVGCYNEWREQAKRYGFSISDKLEKTATPEQKGLDLADFLL